MYPSRKEVPKEHHIALLVKRLIGFMDLVICSECGLIGHPIKSRRGGFRWHRGLEAEYQTREVEKAKMEWVEFGLTPPEVLNRYGKE